MTISLHILKVFSSKEVEARAIFLAMKKVKDRGFFKTHVVSDVKEVINALQLKGPWIGQLNLLFWIVWVVCASDFAGIVFRHIHF